MAKLLKLRRGTTTQHGSFTGAEGEVTVDTDKDVLVVHDGSTAGGHPVAAQDMDNVPAGSILGTQLENSGVSAGTYGSSSAIPIVTVDAQGLVTSASTTAIDSTTIANGTSNVAVANNGNITTTRSGTARLVVDDAGADVTGNINATGNIRATGNGSTISVGDNNDLFITHTNNGLIDCNTGDLTIQTQNAMQLKTADAELGIQLVKHGGVQLYYDTAGPKLETTSSGVSVTGSITSTGTITSTATGIYPLNINGSNNGKIVLQGSSSPYMRFREGTTDKAYFQWNSNGYIELYNEETSRSIKIASGSDGLIYNEGGTERTVWHSGNDGEGSGLDADSLDGIGSTGFLRSNVSDTASGTITFTNGAGAVTIYSGSDIRLQNGTWTGDAAGKIQHHDNYLWFQGGSNGFMFRDDGGTNRLHLDGNGHLVPQANNTYDIGSSGYRFRNIYTNDLHLSNEGSSNDMDGSWGNWTIQEGESDLFLKNNRSGKKYKFNLTEVS